MLARVTTHLDRYWDRAEEVVYGASEADDAASLLAAVAAEARLNGTDVPCYTPASPRPDRRATRAVQAKAPGEKGSERTPCA